MGGSKASKQRAPRRRLLLSEKRCIVELTLREGASTRAVAREHGVHPNSLRNWKALYRAGNLGVAMPRGARIRAGASSATFLPVTVAAIGGTWQPAPDREACGSVVQITMPSGVAIRIEFGALDAALLCALIAQLQR